MSTADVGPLKGRSVAVVGSDSAAEHVRLLLRAFGATVEPGEVDSDIVIEVPGRTVIEDWARSGAMALTGAADGPPIGQPGGAASVARGGLLLLEALTELRTGERPLLPDVTLLGERAATVGLTRAAPWSAGGSTTAIKGNDGWWMLTLARPSDIELLPALVSADTIVEAWPAVARWASGRNAAIAVERAQLLGLPASVVGSVELARAPGRPAVVSTSGGRRTPGRAAPLVVDLTSLWAGPLATSLLAMTGAEVVKVESSHRPDGARSGSPEFFELMNAGKRTVVLDLKAESGRAELRQLIRSADVVVEASRPRALRQLGFEAEEEVRRGTHWVSITAYGRHLESEKLVGFGDDVAAAAGLVVDVNGVPAPCGDAIADPLAGVHAAVAVAAALLSDRAHLLDVSMRDVAACAASVETEAHEVSGDEGQGWAVSWDGGSCEVASPTRRVLAP